MTLNPPLTRMEELLLMAAAVHGLGPDTNLHHANAAKVVGQALEWSGLMDEIVRHQWNDFESHPAIDAYYGSLIRMIRQILPNEVLPPLRPGEALFEGGGNFGTPDDPPAYAHFTSCRLTVFGDSIARGLLEQFATQEPR